MKNNIKCPRCDEYQAYITEATDNPKHQKDLHCAFCNYTTPLKDLFFLTREDGISVNEHYKTKNTNLIIL